MNLTAPPVPILEVRGVVKRSTASGPLRLASLVIRARERVVISGLDASSAELVTNLVTGAMLPDEGQMRIFGTDTAAVTDAGEWCTLVDRVGLVTERAVLLDSLTFEQNLAMPLTLDIDPIQAEVRASVAELARQVGLVDIGRRLTDATASERALLRLGRAIALNPDLLLLELPTAGLSDTTSADLASAVARVADRRGLAVLALTDDRLLGKRIAGRHLRLDRSSGELRESRWARWW